MHAEAQYCEWLNVVNRTYAQALYTNDSNHVFVAGKIDDTSTYAGVYLNPGAFGNMYFAKYTSTGTLLWVGQSSGISTSGLNSIEVASVGGDNIGNFYITGWCYGSHNFGNGITLTATTGQLKRFLIKLNSNGVTQWLQEFSGTASIGQHAFTVDKNNNVYLGFCFGGTVDYSGSSIPLTSTGGSAFDIALVKYTTNGSLVWGKNYGGSGDQRTIKGITIDSSDRIYIAGENKDSWTFGPNTLSDTGLMILKFNANGDPIMGKTFRGTASAVRVGAFENGRLLVTGLLEDSLSLGPNTNLIQSGSGTWNSFVAFFDTSLTCQWAIKDNPTMTAALYFISLPAIRKDNIYIGGYLVSNNTSFSNISIPVYSSQFPTAVMIKLDTLGNVLWAFYAGCPSCNMGVMGVSADRNGDAYLAGIWSDSIGIFNRFATASSADLNSFIAKLTDFSIERGYVNPGPFCAGDSIKVPYSEKGEFNAGNEFIAQLSDSAGNFESNFRELGRVTSTEGGEIKGILPLFNVASSGKYRIRIISTSPVVQSFYLMDTLRLLIYSKDTANAGEDISVCEGQNTRLHTTGGSKWQWSPSAYFVDPADSAKVAGIIAPDTDREYRIIISDSSGCGLTDTDFVFVRVRPPLEVSVPSVVTFCLLRDAVVTAQGLGGDSSQYHFSWRRDGDPLRTILSTTNVLTVSPFSTRRYWVMLTDSCSRFSDSALVTVTPESGVSLTEIPDTTLCYGQSMTIDLSSVACDSSAVVYYWNNGLGTGLSKMLTPQQNTDYQVVARDTVDGRSDTINFSIHILPALDLTLGNDTVLCLGQNLTINPLVNGGNSAYQYRWMADTGTGYHFIDTTASLNVTGNKNISYLLHVTDQCSTPSDSDEIYITVRDELQLEITEDTLVCQGEEVSLWAQTAGGIVSEHLISWYDDNFTFIDTGKVVDVILNSSKTLMAVVLDNCSAVPDTAFVLVDVRDSLAIAPIADQQICYGAEVNIQPVLSGGLTSAYKLFIQNEADLTTADTAFAFTLKPQTTASYVLSLIDGCSKDTAFERFQVAVSEELVAQIDAKDSLCSGESINLKSLVSGGLPAFYAMTWLRNDTLQTAGSSNWFDAPNGSSLYVLVMNDGCSEEARDSLYVVVLPAPQAAFTLSDTLGCSPLQLILGDVSTNHDPSKNEWQISGPNFYSEEPELILTQPGAYDIGLRVSNVLNCSNTFTRKSRVIVYPKPVARFDVRPFARQTDESILFIHTGSGADYFQWNPGDGTTLPTSSDTLSYIYHDSGTYTVEQIAFNAQGCSDTAHYPMTVYLSPFCAIPNAFTVNGDILNETFAPHCSGILSYNMMIMNRWGEILLNCNDCSWDGTYQGEPVPAGVYFYRIEMSSPIEKTFSVGSINLIR